jgi:hypothetical protein
MTLRVAWEEFLQHPILIVSPAFSISVFRFEVKNKNFVLVFPWVSSQETQGIDGGKILDTLKLTSWS